MGKEVDLPPLQEQKEVPVKYIRHKLLILFRFYLFDMVSLENSIHTYDYSNKVIRIEKETQSPYTVKYRISGNCFFLVSYQVV